MITWNKIWLLVSVVIAATLFVIFSPFLDQYIAASAYSQSTHTFYGERALWCKIIYHAVPLITMIIILMPLFWLFIVRHDDQRYKGVLRFGLMVYLVLGLGPGLMVNVVFKDHWGRPRPYQVLRDGENYSPFWVPHPLHKTDNSFPGGHASIGFFLGVPLLFLGRKKTAVVVSLMGGAVVGGVRILQGGHYFSDIVFSGVFVWAIVAIVIYGVSVGVRVSE